MLELLDLRELGLATAAPDEVLLDVRQRVNELGPVALDRAQFIGEMLGLADVLLVTSRRVESIGGGVLVRIVDGVFAEQLGKLWRGLCGAPRRRGTSGRRSRAARLRAARSRPELRPRQLLCGGGPSLRGIPRRALINSSFMRKRGTLSPPGRFNDTMVPHAGRMPEAR